MDPKVVVLLGPPGCGKGTQAARLSSCLGMPAVSTGEILRQEIRSGSDLGRIVQDVLVSGGLVDDELMNEVVTSRLGQRDCAAGCILDGYPRTAAQARYLDRLLMQIGLPSPVIVDFFVRPEEIIERLGHRRQCPTCGRIFSVGEVVRGETLCCDQDGSPLVNRADDRKETIIERLRVYKQNSRDLVGYYRTRDTYHRVSAARSPAEICQEVLSILEKDWHMGLVAGTHLQLSNAVAPAAN